MGKVALLKEILFEVNMPLFNMSNFSFLAAYVRFSI